MTQTEFDEVKLLWKMFYARECFRHVRAAAQHILDAKLEKENPLFYSLVTAVHVLYAKPFLNARGVGRLGEEIIPPEHLELHRLLIEQRHQIYAHRDAGAFEVADYGVANQVRALRLPQEIRLFATDFHSRYPAMPSIIALCKSLEEKSDYHVEKLWTRYAPAVPKKVGEFALNVLDQNCDAWLPQKPMILEKRG